MKNVWKGLIIGGVTGMVGGSAMDMLSGARRKATEVFGKAVDRRRSSNEAHRA